MSQIRVCTVKRYYGVCGGGCAGACDSMTVARISSVMIVRGCLALPPCTPLPLWPAPLPPRPTPLPPLTRTLPLSILLPFGTFYKLCILNGPTHMERTYMYIYVHIYVHILYVTYIKLAVFIYYRYI